MSNPLVAVVIANHNYGLWIMDAIESAAKQSYENKFIFVVDDGSKDDSVEKVTKCCNMQQNGKVLTGEIHKTKIHMYVNPEAQGPSMARNIAIGNTLNFANIYSILDADDVFLPDKIQKSVDVLNQHPSIGATYSDYSTIDVENNIKVRVYKEPFNRNRLAQECIVHSACTIKKEVFEQCGLYDPNLRVAEDYDLWLRASYKFIFVHIPESLMDVRVGSYNSTNTVNKEVWHQSLQYIGQKMAKLNG